MIIGTYFLSNKLEAIYFFQKKKIFNFYFYVFVKFLFKINIKISKNLIKTIKNKWRVIKLQNTLFFLTIVYKIIKNEIKI